MVYFEVLILDYLSISLEFLNNIFSIFNLFSVLFPTYLELNLFFSVRKSKKWNLGGAHENLYRF